MQEELKEPENRSEVDEPNLNDSLQDEAQEVERELTAAEKIFQNPTKTDLVLLLALTLVAVYGFALIPFRAVLLVDYPVLYTVLNGSNFSLLAHGANHSNSFGFLVLMIFVAAISAIKFIPLYYLLGRHWGQAFIEMSFPKRVPLWFRKLENFINRHTIIALALAFIPFSPIPATIILAIAGIQKVSFWKIFGATFIFLALQKTFYVYLGVTFGTVVQSTLMMIDRYVLWVTLALIVWLIISMNYSGKKKPKRVDS